MEVGAVVLVVAIMKKVGRAASWAKGADPVLFKSVLPNAELALKNEQACQFDKNGCRKMLNSLKSTSDDAISRAPDGLPFGKVVGRFAPDAAAKWA